MPDAKSPSARPPSGHRGRRGFLTLTVVGAAVAATAAGVAYWVREPGEIDELEPPEPLSETGERLAEQLRERLDMLELPDATVAKWVNRYEQHVGPWRHKRPSRKDLQNFLLSTDFFPDADEDKPLRFISYYDPYISVCYNPLRYAE